MNFIEELAVWYPFWYEFRCSVFLYASTFYSFASFCKQQKRRKLLLHFIFLEIWTWERGYLSLLISNYYMRFVSHADSKGSNSEQWPLCMNGVLNGDHRNVDHRKSSECSTCTGSPTYSLGDAYLRDHSIWLGVIWDRSLHYIKKLYRPQRMIKAVMRMLKLLLILVIFKVIEKLMFSRPKKRKENKNWGRVNVHRIIREFLLSPKERKERSCCFHYSKTVRSCPLVWQGRKKEILYIYILRGMGQFLKNDH